MSKNIGKVTHYQTTRKNNNNQLTCINFSKHASEPAATADSNGVIFSSVSELGCKRNTVIITVHPSIRQFDQ